MSRQLLITISVLALLFLAGIPVVSADYYTVAPVIRQGGTVFIGEQDLNITGALNRNNTYDKPNITAIGWWASAASVVNTSPYKTLDLSGYDSATFTVLPSQFVDCTGSWYAVNPSTGFAITPPVFTVADPVLSLAVWSLWRNQDITGRIAVQGEPIGFKVNTNMYSALDPARRGPVYHNESDGYIDIKVKDEYGATITSLYNNETGMNTLLRQNVTTQPWIWGSPANPSASYNWSTGALDPGTGDYLYPVGTYYVWAESGLNNMKTNYKISGADYTGKTIAWAGTVALVSDTVKIEANKESVTTGKSFSVTVTGRPGTQYFLWVKDTNTMTGAYDDQPPAIAPNQDKVYFEKGTNLQIFDRGIHPIGDYLYENGGGILSTGSIWSNVATNTTEDNALLKTRYYAMINTSTSGTRTVEWSTTDGTKAQKYTIRVEQNMPAGDSGYGAAYGTGTVKSDEVDIHVEKSVVTIVAAGDQDYEVGEVIKLSGTNTGAPYKTYLFLAGPSMQDAGSQIQNRDPGNNTVVNNDASTFKAADVNGDNTWSWKWDTTNYALNPGTYTIYAVSKPYDKFHLANASYGTVSIIIKKPIESVHPSPATGASGNTITNPSAAESTQSRVPDGNEVTGDMIVKDVIG